jgi:TolA-binding protein
MRLRSQMVRISFKQPLLWVALYLCFLLFPTTLLAGPWAEHVARLQGLQKQIESDEKEIHELIERKRGTEEQEQVASIIKELETKYVDLKKTSDEYAEIRMHVRFQHPERSDTVEQKYARYKLKSLKEMESEYGLDGHLDHAKAHVLATFPIPEKVKPAPTQLTKSTRLPASQEESEIPERIHLIK